jgi:hypothetical protein
MNIDEAIKRHKATATKGNVIFSNNPDLAKKHNKEHEQIVEWLEELKWYWSMLKRCRSFSFYVDKQNQHIKKCEHTFASCHHTESKCSECPMTELFCEEFYRAIDRCYEYTYASGCLAGIELGKSETEAKLKELRGGKMANRALLHINKLKDLEKWLEKQGYMILPTSKNPYEILRAKKDKDTVIIYQKGDSKEHLSIMDKDYPLIHKFITESKPKTNADRIRNMSDAELAGFITDDLNFACEHYCDSFELGCAFNCNKKYKEVVLKWLQSEAE